MPRAYIRLDPEFADRKEGYPDGAFAALVMLICAAAEHSRRGVFKNERMVRVVLNRRSRWLKYLVEHGDVIAQADGTFYLDGWEEWQEGNWMVGERMARIRAKRRESGDAKSAGAVRTANWRLRNAVFERDDYTCRYCGNKEYDRQWLILEHIEPKGPASLENLVTACRPCNSRKGGRTPEEAGMVLLELISRDVETRHGDT